MSLPALGFAFNAIRRHNMTLAARLVLLALANRHNHETGRCDPSIETLCVDTGGLTDRGVRKGLRELERLRLVTTIHRTKRTGRGLANMSNRYRIGSKVPPEPRSGTPLNHVPPKQEYKPSHFDDLIFAPDGAENRLSQSSENFDVIDEIMDPGFPFCWLRDDASDDREGVE